MKDSARKAMFANKYYKEKNGTHYDKETPDNIVNIIEDARLNGHRLQIHYGDKNTGVDWGDANYPHPKYNDGSTVSGTIGRSTGTQKIPLIIKSRRSMGGEGLLDSSIVKIRHSGKGGAVLYQHPKYKYESQ